MGDPKCFLQNQIKGIPEASQMETEAPEVCRRKECAELNKDSLASE